MPDIFLSYNREDQAAYRIIAMCMDSAAIYPFTSNVREAISFMIASNVYTAVAHVIHERA